MHPVLELDSYAGLDFASITIGEGRPHVLQRHDAKTEAYDQ
jgi:hypothetical protein